MALLNRVRTKAVHFAWDNPREDLTGYFRRFLELTAIKSDRRRRVYVLTNYNSTHEQDLYRVETLRGMGYDPYVMVYDRPQRAARHPPPPAVGEQQADFLRCRQVCRLRAHKEGGNLKWPMCQSRKT